ncbi:hypothetical protein KEM54_000140 [Ascosphaera aggregata]|nr:hypothetical protein KEM54_000140 [Ascosphaera aggregata]
MKQRCRSLIAPELEDLNNIHDPKERRKVQNRLSQRKHRKRQKEQLQHLQALVMAIDARSWAEQYPGQALPNCQLPSPTAGSVPRVSTPVLEPTMLESGPSFSFSSSRMAYPFGSQCGPTLCESGNWFENIPMQQEPTGFLPNISPSEETEYSPASEDSAQFGIRTPYEDFHPFNHEQPLDAGPVKVAENTQCESPMDTSSDSEDSGVQMLLTQKSILAVCPSSFVAGGAACARHWCAALATPIAGMQLRRFVPVE